MTRQEALSKLEIMAAASTHPKLGLAELDFCLDENVAGETWDLNRAARDAWELKAGKASDHHDSSVGGRHINASQVYTHCMAQAKKFTNRIVGSIPIDVLEV